MAAAVCHPSKPAILGPKPKVFPRQSSVMRAFTTEDSDIFTENDDGKRTPTEISEGHELSVIIRKQTSKDKNAKVHEKRRRSKSVCAPDFQIRLLPAYAKYAEKSSEKEEVHSDNKECGTSKNISQTRACHAEYSNDPSECKKMLTIMTNLDFPGSPGVPTINEGEATQQTLPDKKTQADSQETKGQEVLEKETSVAKRNSKSKNDWKKPTVRISISSTDSTSDDSAIHEQRSPVGYHFATKKMIVAHNSTAGVNKKLTRKLSRKMTGRMTKRQRQELMLEGEFDEFDVGLKETDELKEDNDSLQSPNNSEEEGNASDDTDHEFETEIVTQLNIVRMTVEEYGGSSDEAGVIRMSKTQRIANELLNTEESYVQKLHLLDQIFHNTIVRENREHQMFPENVVPRIFSNIKSIYQFHHDFLLPQLDKRMKEWKTEPRIGDVMKKFAPFLKLYSEYVKNFDCAMRMINFWTDRSPKFAHLIADLQRMPECGHLSLQHHMLEPIQRVPRYQLLLKDYLNHLQTDAPDYQDTQKALELVAMAASHSNEALRKIEKFRKLLEVNDRLAGIIDLINPARELVKEGKIIRISAKDGDHIERYLFLFNDLLLVCQSLPLSIGSKQQFKIKSKIDVQGLQVFEGHNLETPNTFYVQGQQKSIELHTSTAEEKLEWQNALEMVIADYNKKRMVRKASLKLGIQVDKEIIGKVPPVWVKDRETSMCMSCTATFTTFRRRHHCRACGHVVCGKCSSHKAALPYDGNNTNRVCKSCFNILCPTNHDNGSKSMQAQNSLRQQQQQQHKKGLSILQVKANDPSVISGYLNISCNKKSWLRRWFAVRNDFVLYSFKAHQDIVALTSLPLPGYQVVPVDTSDGIDRENMFKVYHRGQGKVYYLQTEDEASHNRWIDVLQKVVQLQLPSPDKTSETSPFIHQPVVFEPNCLDSNSPA